MKLSQLIEYKRKIIVLQKFTENETGRLVLDLFLFFKITYYEVKASGLQPSFNLF